MRGWVRRPTGGDSRPVASPFAGERGPAPCERRPARARRPPGGRTRRVRRGERIAAGPLPRRSPPPSGGGVRSRVSGKPGGGSPMSFASRVPSFTPARPEEILKPAKPWFVVLTLAARVARQPAAGHRRRARAQARLPRAHAALLVHPGAALRRRRRRVDAGLVMDVGDATLFGQHALAYAVLAYAAEYFRRRVLRFPLWQQAAQVAVLLVLARRSCCSCAWSAARRCRAGPTRCRRSSARCCGRCCRCCCSGRSGRRASPATCSATRPTDGPPPPASRRARRVAATAARLRLRPSCATPSASCPCSAAGWRSPAARCSPRSAVLFGALRLPAGRAARPLPARSPRRTASRSSRSRRTAASSPTATASCSRRATRRTRSRSRPSRVQRPRRDDRRSSPTIVDIQPRDRKRFRKLLEESKNFESLPMRTRLTDEEVARFAVNRYRFPGVEIKARLFRHYPFGEVASHVIGYIGRINDARPRAHRGVGRDRQLQGLRLHRQGRRRALLRARAARHDRRRGGRGRRRRARGAHAVAHAARRRATTCGCRSTSSCRQAAEAAFGDRRGALVAIEPATGDVLAFVSKPGYDPNLFVDGIDPANWQELNESPDKPLLNRPLRGAYPPGSTIKPFLALGALTLGQAHADAGDRRSRATSSLPGASHRFRDDKPGGHGTVDMYKSIVVSCDTYYYHARERDRHRRHRALHVAARLRAARPASTSRASSPACCRRASGSGSASPARSTARSTASGTSATRSRPASARATTRSRRCSSRTRSRRSPTTASRSGRTSCSTVENAADRRGARDRAASRRTRLARRSPSTSR